MANEFHAMFEALKQTADGQVQALEGIKRTIDAALVASAEQEDLRETIHRLEALVLRQTTQIQEVRDRLN